MTTRNPSLDVLRGVAILLVLGVHLKRYPVWTKVGWTGVDLFFVLSGFLVSGLLFAEYKNTGKIQIRRFIFRRGLKIWPSFYVFMIVVGLLIGRSIRWKSFLLTAGFLLNYLNMPVADATYHLWSLAVEEHFYLILPLLLAGLLLMRRSLDCIPAVFGVVAVSCLTLRAVEYSFVPGSGIFARTHLRIDSLFAGVLLGYLFHLRKDIFDRIAKWRALPVLGATCLGLVALMPKRSLAMASIGLSLLYCGFGSILAWCVERKSRFPILTRPIAYIGRHSYGIYLWHLPICLVMVGSSALSFWSAILASVAFGIVATKIVEFPILRLRDRILPRAYGSVCVTQNSVSVELLPETKPVAVI